MRFVKESVLPASPAEVFAFHERPEAFALLLPPWERTEILVPPRGLAVGHRVELRTRMGCFWVKIVAEHVGYEPGRSFEDVMREGPFAHWHHKHLFLPDPGGCRLRDEIDYTPPLGWLGRLAEPFAIRPKLKKLFDYRHEVTRREVLVAASG
ncbi:MAG: SRPBCC family protein [Planctomycetota bacterium]